MSKERLRQPPGTPIGGQFAPDPSASNTAPIALNPDGDAGVSVAGTLDVMEGRSGTNADSNVPQAPLKHELSRPDGPGIPDPDGDFFVIVEYEDGEVLAVKYPSRVIADHAITESYYIDELCERDVFDVFVSARRPPTSQVEVPPDYDDYADVTPDGEPDPEGGCFVVAESLTKKFALKAIRFPDRATAKQAVDEGSPLIDSLRAKGPVEAWVSDVRPRGSALFDPDGKQVY